MEERIVKDYIKEVKEFYCVNNFREEILEWKFGDFEDNNQGLVFHLGHPEDSHKGKGIGDTLAYSRLPQLIKKIRLDSFITMPKYFEPFYRHDPNVDDFQNKFSKWGSLGTWGTTFQRACNVWNIQNLNPFPEIYLSKSEKLKLEMYKKSGIPLVIIATGSVTGDKISKEGIKIIREVVEDKFDGNVRIEQIGLTGDSVVGGAAHYHFDVPDYRNLIHLVARADLYIGPHNGLSHIAKATGVKSIVILTQNIPTDIVYLPYLTQTNILETEMLRGRDIERKNKFIEKCERTGVNLDWSGELGWLYPDNQHLTDSPEGTERCPELDYDNMFAALCEELYPFKDERLWNIEKYKDLWCEGDKETDKVEENKPINIQENGKDYLATIGIQILSYNKHDLLVKTVDSLIDRAHEDLSYRYEINILEQSDNIEEKKKILKIFLSEDSKYRRCGVTLKLWNSPKNLGQRGGSNFLYKNGCWDGVDFIMFTDHDNIFHEPLSVYVEIINKYQDCYVATGYHSPEHDVKRIVIDDFLGTIMVKSTARFGHHFMRKEDVFENVLPMDESCSCGGASWYCGADWWVSHWSPNAPGRTERNDIGFIFCLPGAVEHIGVDRSTWLGDEFKHPEYSLEDHEWIRGQKDIDTILKRFPNRNVY